MPIPPTKHGLNAMEVLSAMQKAIRRSNEVDAMRFAVELIHTSPEFCSMVCNRLVIIAHEDVDSLQAPWVVPYVQSTVDRVLPLYRKRRENPGGARMLVGNCIMLMCRAPKSRRADHFQAAIGLASLLEGYAPRIPDYALDKHTAAGKRMRRGLDHFRKVGTTLMSRDGEIYAEDEYADEAYRLWALKKTTSSVGQHKLFGDE